MDKIEILCEKDTILLEDFSRRSHDHMQRATLLSRTLSLFFTYMKSNVNKEIEKDALIIREAGAAFAAGRPVCDVDLEEIFEKTKKIDKAFLDNLLIPSFAMTVRYGDIADIRIRRIWRISKSVYAIMEKWTGDLSFNEVVRKTFSRSRFNAILVEILHLYNEETRMLSDSVHAPFHKTIHNLTEDLYHAMEESMEDLAAVYTQNIYGDESVHA